MTEEEVKNSSRVKIFTVPNGLQGAPEGGIPYGLKVASASLPTDSILVGTEGNRVKIHSTSFDPVPEAELIPDGGKLYDLVLVHV